MPSTVVLNTRKAFPSAFGYGQNVTGGRGGIILEVTNGNNSGPGSLRAALEDSRTRIILIRYSGIINLTSNIELNDNQGNFTLLGNFSTGQGTTITGGCFGGANGNKCNNYIVRGITWRSNAGVVEQDDTFAWLSSSGQNLSGYIDRCSLSYGYDEILTVRTATPSMRFTAAYNLQAEAHQNHNRGGIFGGFPNQPNTLSTGFFTNAFNMYYNLSARFPNWSGNDGGMENFNNLIVNWSGRLTRTGGNGDLDWFNNYGIDGNSPNVDAGNVFAPHNNKLGILSTGEGLGMRLYTKGNIIEGFNTDPNSNQENLWSYFYDRSGYPQGEQVVSSFFSNARLLNGGEPSGGILSATDARQHALDNVGNCYRTDVNGEPTFSRDAKDTDYISKTINETTESTYRSQSQFDIPNKNNTTQFPDNIVTHLPDAWVTRHNITSVDQVKSVYNFDNYDVINDAGYTALEIFSEYVIGGLDLMAQSSTIITTPSLIKKIDSANALYIAT